jgi:uncharacterized phage protein gp47/JayE
MALETPELDEIIERLQTDFQNELPDTNVFQQNSFIKALLVSMGGRFDEFYTQTRLLKNSIFLLTAQDDFLSDYGSIYGITPLPAKEAVGNITVTGTASTVVPLGESFQSSGGDTYNSTAAATITMSSQGGTIEATGLVVTDPLNPALIGTFQVISVSSATQFSYMLSGATVSGTAKPCVVTTTIADVPVKSVKTGSDTNLDSGEQVSFTTLLAGADATAYVQFGGVSGGMDSESNTSYRDRILERIRNPVASFSVDYIEQTAKTINGVTRVFVFPVTPIRGKVTVYFVRDGDSPIFPNAAQIAEVKTELDKIRPVEMPSSYLIVASPVDKPLSFNFSALSPDSATMREAVKQNLLQFIFEKGSVGKSITKLDYDTIIKNTIDPKSGFQVDTFTLTNPTSDIILNNDELPTLTANDIEFDI